MKPLSRKQRRLSLGLSLLVFIVVAPFIVAYSTGYRLSDLGEKLQIIQTGGIYIHSEVPNSNVFIDGEFFENNGTWIRNTLIQNLSPKKDHVVEIHKEGYHSWIKLLEVNPSFVSEGHALLLPKEIEKTATYQFVDAEGVATTTESDLILENPVYFDMEVLFSLASSTEEISAQLKAEEIAAKNAAKLLEQGITASTTLEVKKDIPEYFVELGIEDPDELENLIINGDQVSWLENGDIVTSWIGRENEIPYYYCKTIGECITTIGLDWDDEIIRFGFLPGRDDVWIVQISTGIWAVEVDDRSARNIQPIYEGENLDFRINERNRLIVLDEEVFYELTF